MLLIRFDTLWRRSRFTLYLVITAIALLLLNLAIKFGQAAEHGLTATVDYASSGDTLELLFELSPEMPITTIRLAGIQAPNLEQEPWGQAARQCLQDLRNAVIQLETEDWTADQYGRLWAYGWHGREMLNRRVLAEGCGYLTEPSQGPHYQELLYAQELARLLGLGIWDPKQPLRETQ